MHDRDYNDQGNTVQDAEFISAWDLVNKPSPPISWLVDGLFPIGAMSVIGARPKVGKSTLARWLAVAVARGADFFGRDVVQGRVLYTNFEEGQHRVADHFRKFGIKATDELLLSFVPPPRDGIAWLTKQVMEYEPVLVIVDPMMDIIPNVTDISDYVPMSRELGKFLRLAHDMDSHICFLHHGTKADTNQGRELLGSTAILARSDCTILIGKDDKSHRSIYTIQRDGDDIDPAVELTLEPDGRVNIGRPVHRVKANELDEKIVKFLSKQSSPVATKIILSAIAGNNGKIHAALKALVTDGRIARSKSGRTNLYEKVLLQ